MAQALVLSKQHVLQGVFTQRKILWGIIEGLEELSISAKNDQIDSLLVRMPRGKIEREGNKYSPCTYANVCKALRERLKIALYDEGSLEPLYAIWQTELNEPFSEMDEEEIEEEEEKKNEINMFLNV